MVRSVAWHSPPINQPDYTAMQQFFFTEGLVGFGLKSKVAKKENRRVEVTEDATYISEPGKPTIKIFPKRKEYAEIPLQEKDDFTVSTEELASRSDVVFKSLGIEKRGGYTCINFEASYKFEHNASSQRQKAGAYFFITGTLND